MLKNLSKLKKSVEETISGFSGQEITLDENFKLTFEKVLNENEKVYYNDYSVTYYNSHNQVIYFPNQWFYMAALALPFTKEILNYKKVVDGVIKENNKNLERVALYGEAKNNKLNSELVRLIQESNFENEEKEILIIFVTEYDEWGGGKTIDRNDFFVSPTLSILNVINASSEFIATIVSRYTENEELYYAAQNLLENKLIINGENINNKIGVNKIFYGAPGTGKSYAITQEVKKTYRNFDSLNDSDSSFVFRATLHPEYSYSDFVGQIMPTTDESQNAKFTENLGIFTQALKMSLAYPKQHVFLILEEMSRANVAAIFGDLFQLLDRDETGKSEYQINNSFIAKAIYSDSNTESKKIYIPNNLTIIGTVNTSDQNVFIMDTAFKRRFEMVYTSIKAPDNFEDWKFKYAGKDISWNEFRINLNQFMTKEMKLSEDKQLGAFFIAKNSNPEIQIQNKLLNYLWEDVEKSSIFNSEKSLFADEYRDGNFSDIYFNFQEGKEIFNSDIIPVNQDDKNEDY
ncbi:hypothetical protein FACS1894193_06200 [Bacilli bacterium]|nr:hypothetical protein FACS1894193_06200 [Bacilli bacterium]GHU46182.1 hypothetical protein FACS1894194_3410 [Bacilli bacterium]